ncbi:MAG: NADH-quinone oxidoreductase subunit N [Bacillota bacterium]
MENVFYLLIPELIVGVLGLLLLVLGLLVPKSETKGFGLLALSGLVIVFLSTILYQGQTAEFLGGMYVIDPFATFFKQLVLIAAFLVVLASLEYVGKLGYHFSEYYSCLAFIVLGMMMMVSAGDLITFYVGLELMTLTFVILTAFEKKKAVGTEAGLKYLILGGMSSAVLLYGLSLLYGATGTTIIKDMVGIISDNGIQSILVLGMVFALSGFAFKISAVPFHMWSPDIYEGAPTPITAFLAVASKAAAFAVFVRIFITALPDLAHLWIVIVTVLAVLTMILGNLVAIPQTNIKRMLAYSSIAQAGYILLGLIAFSELGITALLFYSMAYVFANVGAFAVVIAFYNKVGSDQIKDYSGLARRSPLLAAVMFVCLISLAGLPPTAGFAGKLLLFTAVIEQGYVWLAFIGILMSMVSVYYYLIVVKHMYLGKAEEGAQPVTISVSLKTALVICLTATIFLGLYWTPLLNLALQAAQSLF